MSDDREPWYCTSCYNDSEGCRSCAMHTAINAATERVAGLDIPEEFKPKIIAAIESVRADIWKLEDL